MTNEEAIKKLSFHMMQCGMMMPIEWVQANGEGSELMEAFQMAIAALKGEPPVLKTICGVTGTACVDCKGGSCQSRRVGVPSDGQE